MEYFNMPKDTLATHSELARAQLDIFQPIMTPPPDALQLPPYQETEDSFLVWSAVLPPPPMHMRGFGMSEFLWACFFDWMWTADELKWILLERIALGYRLRWPHRQVLIRTPEQLSWIRRHPPGPPRHIISRIEGLFLGWVEDLRHKGGLALFDLAPDAAFAGSRPYLRYPESAPPSYSSPVWAPPPPPGLLRPPQLPTSPVSVAASAPGYASPRRARVWHRPPAYVYPARPHFGSHQTDVNSSVCVASPIVPLAGGARPALLTD